MSKESWDGKKDNTYKRNKREKVGKEDGEE